jgi:hypothetical protein
MKEPDQGNVARGSLIAGVIAGLLGSAVGVALEEAE